LKNVMLPYTKQITVSDATAPNPTDPAIVDVGNGRLYVTFDEAVALSGDGSAIDKSKYMVSKDNGITWIKLPDSTQVNIQGDLKTVIISVPPADLSLSGVNKLRVSLVKDVAGNYISGYTKDVSVTTGSQPQLVTSGTQAKATSATTLEVYVDRTLLANTFNLSDFTVKAGSTVLNLVSGSIDGKTIKLTLADSNKLNADGTYGTSKVQVTIRSNATTSSPDGQPLKAGTTTDAVDGIAASVTGINGSSDGSKVTVTFNEDLQTVTNDTNTATDFVVKDKDGNVLTPGTAYKVTIDTTSKNVAQIIFQPGYYQTGVVSVQVQNPRFLKDVAGNVVAASDEVQTLISVAAPTATIPAATGTDNDGTTLVITFDQPLYIGGTAVANGANVASSFTTTGTAVIGSAVYDATAHTVTITFSPAAANGDTVKAVTGANALTNFAGVAYVPETITYDGTNTLWTK